MSRELLCGPAGSGKTDAVLAEYVSMVREHGEDSALLLLPNRLACDRIRRRLVEDDCLGGMLDPRVLTFPDLADLILRANHAEVSQLPALQQSLLMRSVVEELCEAGELPTLAPLRDLPGLIDSLVGAIEEIKRLAIRPEEFARRLAAGGRDGGKNVEIARVYARYQERLRDLGLYDDPGRFWRARDVLRDGDRRPFEELRLVIADGFDDFTTTQLQVLDELAGGGERLVITLCLEEDESRRPELFSWPRRTLGRIREVLGEMPLRWQEPSEAAGPLAQMGEGLFAEEGDGAQPDAAGVAEVIEASGRRMEARQIAVRVKRLLRAGADPERIAILARDIGAYARALAEVCREVGVPLRVQASMPVAARPPVQAVLGILHIPARGYVAGDVMRLIKSNFFDRSALPDPELDPDEIERIVREANIIGGRGRADWRERLRALDARIRDDIRARERGLRDDDERRFAGPVEQLQAEIALIERVEQALSAIFDAFEALPARGSLAQMTEATADLIERFGIREAIGKDADPAAAAANINAFEGLREGLRQLRTAEHRLRIDGEVSLAEFYREVQRLAAGVTFEPPGPEPGVVAMEVDAARQLDFDHVFVLGMTERQFPRAPREDALFSDDDREALTEAGIPLEPRSRGAWEDAFLFYSVCVSAREHLTLSYPDVDAEGREVLRSWYVDEMERCFADEVPLYSYGLAQTVPEFDDAASVDELTQRALFELLGRDPIITERDEARAQSALRALAAHRQALLTGLLRGIEVEDRRESALPPDEYDGRLSDAAARADVAERFGAEAYFSAGRLAQYGNCPFAFFAERVLGVSELTEPSDDADVMLLGELRHRTLSLFFGRWREESGRGWLAEEDLPRARELMDAIVDELFRETAALGLVANRDVFALAREDMKRDMHLWLAFEVEHLQAEGHTADAREVSFGFGRAAPVIIGEGEERVMLRGRLDRMDRMDDGFAVYDYKSSDGPSPRRIDEGLDFQLPVYAMAARANVIGDEGAVCREWGYYKVRRPIHMRRSTKPERIEEYIASAREWALRHAARIRAAQFAPDPQTCATCAFRGICRWNENRFQRKQGGDGDER